MTTFSRIFFTLLTSCILSIGGAHAGLPFTFEVCGAQLKLLGAKHRFVDISEKLTNESYLAFRDFRRNTIGFQDNNVWGSYEVVADSNHINAKQSQRIGLSIRELEKMYEGEFPAEENEKRIVAGTPIRGASNIRKYLEEIDNELPPFRATQAEYWNRLRRFTFAFGALGTMGVETAIDTGNSLWAAPSLLFIASLQWWVGYFVMLDHGYRKNRQRIDEILNSNDSNAWFFQSQSLLAQDHFPMIWETGSLDAYTGTREAAHEIQNLNLNSKYEPQLLQIDRLLRFEKKSDGSEEPVLYSFVRFAKNQPPAPKKVSITAVKGSRLQIASH